MFRSLSPYGNDTISYSGSMQSSSFSVMDDESSQLSILSRPSAKSIYLQRKDYAASVNKVMDTSQYRVEHLFTCELNTAELRNVADCVERLKVLEETGRLWGQSMLLEVCGSTLLLTDIETKMELDSVHVGDIMEVKAVVPDSGVFRSLLTVSFQQRGKTDATVFMFQCEDVKAAQVEKDLARALATRRNHPAYRTAAEHKSLFTTTDLDGSDFPEMRGYSPYDEEAEPVPRMLTSEELSRTEPYTPLDKKVDILNHILGDIEIFVGQLSAAAAAQSAKKKKKKKKKKLEKISPNAADFASCLKKFKCAFNILMEVDGQIDNPSSLEFVHMLLTTLAFVVSHSPNGLPQTVVTPLLVPQFVDMMNKEATEEEFKLWQFLGDAWNVPSNEWPGDEKVISTYTLEFSDGWQPPKVSASFDPKGRQTATKRSQSPHDVHSDESKQREMLVLYDFTSRNGKELTVRKGDIVELLDQTNQWWKVRDGRGVEGYVPNNVMKSNEEPPLMHYRDSVRLTKRSKPPEVKAWLQQKGFRDITVRCLAGLSGSTLLNMSREELKVVCPEEGGRVFFQLQAVRSTLAIDS